MAHLTNIFNEVNKGKNFAHFKDFPENTDFKVVRFFKCTTKFGKSVVVETKEHLFHIPHRFINLFDTQEKIDEWNGVEDLHLVYLGMKGTTISINMVVPNNDIWTWTCENDKCVKKEYLGRNIRSNYSDYTPLEVCKLICGPFGPVWPRPTEQIYFSKHVTPIHPADVIFDLSHVAESNEIFATDSLMWHMKQKFIQDLRTICDPECIKFSDTSVLIKISTVSPDSKITWNTDESYRLNVNTTGNNVIVSINATTVFGARHGLETLFQLTTVVETNKTRVLILINEASVIDKPVYSHRGLLIDTSRNYLKVSTIEKMIDGMAHSKMNVLHWHATDSHSFPLLLPGIPEMAEYGAYSSQKIYTLQDVHNIIFYAKVRGVRVLMEIDSPAHAGNGWQWGEKSGLGKLAVCINKTPWRTYCIQPPCGQLNPYNNNTYKVLGSIYRDLISVFPKGETFHMGGDELTFQCWNSTDEIVEQMEKEGLERNTAGFLQLWANFHLKSMSMLDDIRGSSKTPIILWSSQLTTPENIHFFNNQRSKIIIQTWVESSDPMPINLLNLNYKLIMSTKDAWYLDHGVWGRTVYYQWTKVYDNRIPEFSKGVLGGEVCMWGEYVDDSAIESRIWPRAAAAAERLWSDPESSSASAVIRFLQQRERLVKIGIRAEAITPEWCYENDDQCS